MRDIDLDALERLAEAATEGPWRQYGWLVEGPEDHDYDVADCLLGGIDHEQGEGEAEEVAAKADAAFIAASRTAVPALIAEVRRLRQRINEVNENAPHALDNALDSLTRTVNERDNAVAGLRAERARTERLVGLLREAREIADKVTQLDHEYRAGHAKVTLADGKTRYLQEASADLAPAIDAFLARADEAGDFDWRCDTCGHRYTCEACGHERVLKDDEAGDAQADAEALADVSKRMSETRQPTATIAEDVEARTVEAIAAWLEWEADRAALNSEQAFAVCLAKTLREGAWRPK